MDELDGLKRKFQSLKISDDDIYPIRKRNTKIDDDELYLLGQKVKQLQLVPEIKKMNPVIDQQCNALVLYMDRTKKFKEDSYRPIQPIQRHLKFKDEEKQQKQ
ncbi:hypothetical protein pb186bvf_017334 [Paramecium bursaria]